MNDDKLNDERKRFVEAFNKSRFHNKAEFDLSNYILKDEIDSAKEIEIE